MNNYTIKTIFTILLIVNFFSCNVSKNNIHKPHPQESILCSEPSFSYYLKLPKGLKGYFDYDEGLDCSKRSGKPLLVYFSTHLSIDSREMESLVLLNQEIVKIINEHYILVSLCKDGNIYLPLESQVISSIDGDTIRTLADKCAYYQTIKFKEDIEPAFYIVNSKEELLANPYYYNLSTTSFKEFLKNGVEKHLENR